jgi:hypothetical protein
LKTDVNVPSKCISKITCTKLKQGLACRGRVVTSDSFILKKREVPLKFINGIHQCNHNVSCKQGSGARASGFFSSPGVK